MLVLKLIKLTIFIHSFFMSSFIMGQMDHHMHHEHGSMSSGENPKYIVMHTDPWIPNFSHHQHIKTHVLESSMNGPWSSPMTWGGTLPGPHDVVLIKHHVLFDIQTEVYNLVVMAHGKLEFKASIDTSLKLGTLQVLPNGSLIIGSKDRPIQQDKTAEIIFSDRQIDLGIDPAMFGNGLLAFGNVQMHGHNYPTTFVRLSKEVKAGAKTLLFDEEVTHWKEGDSLLLPNSLASSHVDRRERGSEILKIKSINGNRVELESPVAFDHDGSRDAVGNIEFHPHIGHISRNIILRSENPNGVRGHTLFGMRADVDIRYSSFLNLGRTINHKQMGLIDKTTFDENGQPIEIATNHIARYSLHTHHLVGPTQIPENGYQFTLVGNFIDVGSAEKPHRWGIVIHGSHFGLIKDNIVFRAWGAGIIAEDGSETENLFDHNFAVSTFGSGNDAGKGGSGGAGFWFRGVNNYVRNNVSADSAMDGFTIFLQDNKVKDVKNKGRLNFKYPAFQGAMPMMEGQGILADRNATTIREFSNNEAYGRLATGINLWALGGEGHVIKNFTVWNIGTGQGKGLFSYGMNNLILDHFVVRGGDLSKVVTHKKLNYQVAGIGINNSRAGSNITLKNADIQGVIVGVDLPPYMGSDPDEFKFFNIFDSKIVAHYGLSASIITEPGRKTPMNFFVKNSLLKPLPIPIGDNISTPYAIYMDNLIRNRKGNAHTNKINIYVENHNQVSGDDFQAFFDSQKPEALIPSIDTSVEGMTNAEAWNDHLMAIAGAITPCQDTASHPDVFGFTCPLPQQDLTAPAPVTGLTLQLDKEGQQIHLTWNPSSDDNEVIGYKILRDGEHYTSSAQTFVVDGNIENGKFYRYTVIALDQAGNESAILESRTMTVDLGAASLPPSLPETYSPQDQVVLSKDRQKSLLVDFGSSPKNTFMAEPFNTILKDRYTGFFEFGPAGMSIDRGANRIYNFQGIKSDQALLYRSGDQIIVTWYNHSNRTIRIKPYISFEDPDRRGRQISGNWSQMSEVAISPDATAQTIFTFDQQSSGEYSLININSNFSNTRELICDKIELLSH